MNYSDWRAVFLLTFIYFQQGEALGFFVAGLQIILVENGYSFSQIGILSLTGIPFTLKFLWSPILDYYFIGSVGQRKTYILPGLLLTLISYFYLSEIYNYLLQNQLILHMFSINCFILFLTATIDTAVDGWQITLLTQENVGLGSVCQTFGQSFGWFCSSYLLLLLNSTKNSEGELIKPLITIPQYFQFMGFQALILIIIVVFSQEKNPNQVIQLKSFKEQLLITRGIYLNKYLRLLSIILLLQRIGVGILESVAPVYLIQIGFSRLQLSKIAIVNFILTFIVPILVAKYITGKKLEIQASLWSIKIQVLNLFSLFITITYYKFNPNQFSIFLIGINFFIFESLRRVYMIVNFAFIAQITEAQLGAMSIALLGSIFMFSRAVIDHLLVLSLQFIPFFILLTFGIIEEIWFLLTFGKSYQMLMFLPKEKWSFLNVVQQDEFIELIDKH